MAEKRTAKPLAKIALEILHIFGCNFGTKQPILQNRPKFASNAGLLYNYLQQPKK